MKILPPIRPFTGTWIAMTDPGESITLKEDLVANVSVVWRTHKGGRDMILKGLLRGNIYTASGDVFEVSLGRPSLLDRLFHKTPRRKPWAQLTLNFINDTDLFLAYRRTQGGTNGYRMNKMGVDNE